MMLESSDTRKAKRSQQSPKNQPLVPGNPRARGAQGLAGLRSGQAWSGPRRRDAWKGVGGCCKRPDNVLFFDLDDDCMGINF